MKCKPIRANEKPWSGVSLRSRRCVPMTRRSQCSAQNGSMSAPNDVCANGDIARARRLIVPRLWRAQCRERENERESICVDVKRRMHATVTGSPGKRAEIHCITHLLSPLASYFLLYVQTGPVYLLRGDELRLYTAPCVSIVRCCCWGGAGNLGVRTRGKRMVISGALLFKQNRTIKSFVMGK